MKNNAISKETINDETSSAETYTRLLPEFRALAPDELVPINLDVPSVVATTLGALPEIRALRSEIEQQIPGFDLKAFDHLEDFALALHHAHTQYLTATQPADDLEAVATEAAALRQTLHLDATALSHRGLIDANKLKELRGPNGYKNLATDLAILASVLKESWPQIEGRTGIAPSELERALKLGQRLVRIVGLREQGPATVAVATELRQRAFTLLFRTYDNIRRAVTFLRWNGNEADAIAPSLYAGRGGGRRRAETPSVETPQAPVVPVESGAGPGASAAGATAVREDAREEDGPFVGG
jgi:hypothetical protein